MAVITVSRLIGSGGLVISKEVSKILGYKFADRKFIQAIMDKYGETTFRKIYNEELSIWDRYSAATDEMLSMFNRIILSIAKLDNVVIIGRGSFFGLREYKNVLNVMIHAPMAARISAIAESKGITDMAQAKDHIINHDKIRKAFIERTYNIKWNRVSNFDMVFNMAKLKSFLVTEMIVTAAQELGKKAFSPGSCTKDIPGDETLDKIVKEQFLI